MTEYRVDWSELLCRLRARTGRPLAWVARNVAGMDERSINRLARGDSTGEQLRFQQGLRLLDYAADHLQPEDWARIRGGMRA